ncbi:MAG: efflux RND transporter periplasmic adaptor subunit [Candidatus Aureabacteria bacterium]|nr:efflux RND transporter periplasmic adaptor subunit [Candidatus Auribacterota bacterium]
MQKLKTAIVNFMKWLTENKTRLVAVIVAAVLAVVLLLLFVRYEEKLHANIVKVSGTIEGDNVRISFRVGGQITELLTDEGQVVKTGDIVARLDTDELTKIRDEAAASLEAEKYRHELAAIDYVRFENLYRAGAVSAQKRDDAKTKADSTKANVDELRAKLALAETRLGYADLASPLNGFILVKSALPGEVVKEAAPVFTSIDLDDVWVTAYINETDLGRVKLNQKASVMTDTFRGKKYPGWVSYISQEAEFTPKYIQTTEERVKLVYRIKVRVDNSSLDLKPGMPADAYIETE